MNRILILLMLFLGGSLSAQSVSIDENPLSYNEKNVLKLNGIWDFKYIPSVKTGNDSLFYKKDFDVSGWANIKVPGHWELQGFAEPTYGNVKEGTGLYRKLFKISPENKNRQIFVQFDGVLYGYDIYINEKFVGSWASSYNSASFNITDFIDFAGENLLAVRVSTHPRGFEFDLFDCWGLSGIFRDVSIFSTPETYLQDYTVKTKINANGSATVNVLVELRGATNLEKNQYQLKLELKSPEEELISKVLQVQFLSGNSFQFEVKSPVLWTAETPNLYDLNLFLIQNGKIIQEKKQAVGIREISIDNVVLKLNGSPLKLRGVNHHDIVPETGRTMSREQIVKDLMLMKKANINYIRTSHYPPDHRLLDLCDSLGIYVSCEVPFSCGRLLSDTTYQDILLKRAKATLHRDKNHPSIIIWSIGNENPLTPITEVTGRYVQKSDPTRLICYPQMGSYFRKNYKTFSDFMDIYTPHYCGDWWIKEFAKETTKPVILTEYSHARGLTFGDLEVTWKELFRNKQFAGGAVWHFNDQAILRKSSKSVDVFQRANCAWKDSITYYDSWGGSGTDGIVYADRTPQVDYWELRKVYSPVQVIETKLPVVAGKQTLQFSIYNQFDFSNLDILHGKWSLYKNRKVVQTGNIIVNCAPHDTIYSNVSVDLPDHPAGDIWYLRFDFYDKNQKAVYEHTIELKADNADVVNNEILDKLKKARLKMKEQNGVSKIESNGICYEFSKKDLSLTLSCKNNNLTLIVGGLYSRVGRGLVINDLRAKDKSKYTSWVPHLISASKVENLKETFSRDIYNLSGDATFLRGDDYPGEQLDGNISYSLANDGILSVVYNLKPENVSGIIMEAGVSFTLSEQITDFMWVGKGLYSSYPGKEVLSDFGIHYLKKGDLYFHGNRSNVSLAVLSDSKGNGIAIIGEHSNIAVEVEDDKIVVSHLGFLTGKNTKVPATDISEVKGEFKIIVLHAGHWPEKILELVGAPEPYKQPFQPFWHSYEQTQ